MPTQEEIRSWYTRAAAASHIGCSERQIERWAADANKDAATKIRRAHLKIPGRKAMPRFRPEDVDRIRENKVAGQAVVEEAAQDAREGQMHMVARAGGSAALTTLAEALVMRAENERDIVSGLVPALEAFAAGVQRLCAAAAPAQAPPAGNGAGKPPRPVLPLRYKLLLTIAEAAAFGFSPGELRARVAAGEIPNRGSARKFKVARRDLERLAEGVPTGL